MSDLTKVNFSNNSIAIGNKSDIVFIDYLIDYCEINKCQITDLSLITNEQINESISKRKETNQAL